MSAYVFSEVLFIGLLHQSGELFGSPRMRGVLVLRVPGRPADGSRANLVRQQFQELLALDMVINAKKSACMRVGPRYNVRCCSIVVGKPKPALG